MYTSANIQGCVMGSNTNTVGLQYNRNSAIGCHSVLIFKNEAVEVKKRI